MRVCLPRLRCRFFGLALVLLSAGQAWADLPLTVEDLITEQGRVRLDVSLTYANVDRQGVSTGEPIEVQTGPTSFVFVPTVIGESIGNTDTWVATLGLRYGLSARAEVYLRASGLSTRTRNIGVAGATSSSETRFADAWAGLNYRFIDEGETPGLLGFAEIALSEQHRQSRASFQSAMLGLTAYRAIDPIVFSLTAGYRFNQSRPDGPRDYRPGNLLLLHPSVGFAVNDRVTLSTGLQWTRRSADRIDGQRQGINRSASNLVLGVGYGIAKGNTLNASFKVNASGQSGAEFRLNWLYTFPRGR